MAAGGAQASPADIAKTVFVSNIGFEVTESQLRTHFSSAAPVSSVSIALDQSDQPRSRGFAFVQFETADGAQAAVNRFDNTEVFGRTLRVQLSHGGAPRRMQIYVGNLP